MEVAVADVVEGRLGVVVVAAVQDAQLVVALVVLQRGLVVGHDGHPAVRIVCIALHDRGQHGGE